MAVWQYRCISCGNVHEAPLRPDGSVYLRCVATREWAWYNPEAFAVIALAEAVPARAARGATRKVAARSSRAAARRSPGRARAGAARGRSAPKRGARAKRKRR